jgi:hypothetical protein
MHFDDVRLRRLRRARCGPALSARPTIRTNLGPSSHWWAPPGFATSGPGARPTPRASASQGQEAARSRTGTMAARRGQRRCARTRGCRYTSAPHGRLATAHNIRRSVGGAGSAGTTRPPDLLRHQQDRALHRQPWPARTAARQAIFEYIEGWYNTRRHSTLGYRSPRGLRSHGRTRERSSVITSSTLSVETGQAQVIGACRRGGGARF